MRARDSESGASRTDTELGEATPTAAPPAPAKLVERQGYAIAGEHARGGLGRILRGRDRWLDRPVAIKELHRAGPDAERRFLREARLTARLQHPAIVPIYEAGRWPSGEPFYAMKMVAGRELKELIAAAPDLEGRLALLRHVVAVA